MNSSNRLLYLTVFMSGMATLAIELSASRLLGSVFGTSNIVWANVIGLILIYLTIGYFIGGRIADRHPNLHTLFTLIVWGAFLSAIIPLISKPILQAAARAFSDINAGVALGSFVTILILFSVPITILGTVSPFAIRLAVTTVETAGKVSGQIYAISTLGSIIGTFLPVLLIIPELGTTLTFLLFSGLLYLVGFFGLLISHRKRALFSLIMPIIVMILFLLTPTGPLRAPEANATLLYDGESAYNYIQVQEDMNGYRYLYLNEGQGIHSQWHPDEIFYNRTWDYFLAGPYFNPDFSPEDMQSIMIVGLATGTIARQHIAVYGDIPMVGVEIDPDIIEVGEKFFDMNSEEMPSLKAYAEDGRYILNQLDRKYTVVGIDAYKPPYIPWHLTTVEFFEEIKTHLVPNGVVVINVGRTTRDRRFVDAITNTMQYVYPSIHAIDVPQSLNTILIATQRPTTNQNLINNLNRIKQQDYPLLATVLTNSVDNLTTTSSVDIVFTDDRAPVETLVDSLVLNFLLGGEADILR